MSKEVVTFQLGHLSNFVGTHWWNLQESSFVYDGERTNEKAEINHDVTFREGLTLKEEVTYTPRLISVDLSDAINNLKLDGVLYDLEPDGDQISWAHDVTMHKAEIGKKKNEFLQDLEALDNPGLSYDETKMGQRSSKEEMEIDKCESEDEAVAKESLTDKVYSLDDSISSWTDYLRLHLHPQTLSVIKKFYHSDNSFNVHNHGSNLYGSESLDLRMELEDKIHFYTEEADQLQGFHFLADIYDGFGGVASAVASDLSDEFPKKGCISFCPFRSTPISTDSSQSLHDLINTVLSVVKLTKAGFTVVPLSLVDNPWKSVHLNHTQLPGVIYKDNLPYHTSAILAAALDTATLSHRLLEGALPLAHLTDTLSAAGRMVSDLSLAFPVVVGDDWKVTKSFTTSGNPFTSLTPLYNVNVSRRTNVQSVIIRGARSVDMSAVQEALSTWSPAAASSLIEVHRPCTIKAPYPHIFESNIDEFGRQCSQPRPKEKVVQRVAAMTSLSTTDYSQEMLQHLLERSTKLTKRHLHKHLEAGLELDDWNEILSDLKGLTQKYEDDDGHMTESDSD